MVKESNTEEDKWFESLHHQLDRVDHVFDEVEPPSLDQLELLAIRTIKNRSRRLRIELALFLLVAVLIVGGGLMAALATPTVYMVIHGVSMMAGIFILITSKGFRTEGKKESR